MPFTPRQQQITAREVYNWNILELCRVSTDTGHVGWGETVVHYTWSRVTDGAVEKVLGESPARMMHDDSLGCGLQMALFDVVGRILEVPVHQLLGTKVRDWVPISWWSIDASPVPVGREEAQEAVANGYTSFKVKPRPWWDILEQVEAIDRVVPRYFRLDLDPNGTFQTAAAAIPILEKLERYDIVAMFEEPIPRDDIAGNRRIRQAINRPLAMHFGSPPYVTVLREEVCDGYVLCAGESAVMRQGMLSAEARMPFWLQLVGNGLTTAWAAHLGAVLTHATWPAITCINLFTHQLLEEKGSRWSAGTTRCPRVRGSESKSMKTRWRNTACPRLGARTLPKEGSAIRPSGAPDHQHHPLPGRQLRPHGSRELRAIPTS